MKAVTRIPRLSVRRIMIVVAITAVALGANDMRQRWDRFRALRSMHEWNGRACSALAERHASTAAENEREAKRLRAALSSGHYAVRSGAELVAQIASNTEAAAAIERAEERKSRARPVPRRVTPEVRAGRPLSLDLRRARPARTRIARSSAIGVTSAAGVGSILRGSVVTIAADRLDRGTL